MTNYSAGHEAEKYAARYLEQNGYKIIQTNWRTPVCEIDVIAKKNDVIHFVEVKYRSNNQQGYGLEYVTPKKLKQMEFAARSWVNENSYEGDWLLSALEMSGDFEVGDFIESLT